MLFEGQRYDRRSEVEGTHARTARHKLPKLVAALDANTVYVKRDWQFILTPVAFTRNIL